MQDEKPPRRAICAIAEEIFNDWAVPSRHALPYLQAMREIRSIHDSCYADSAKSVVLYFLSSAATYRGPKAKALKAELKGMLND